MSAASTILSRAVDAQDHIRGAATAPVTIVEYGDYQCPYCGQSYAVLRQVLGHKDAVADSVRYVFRNFPLNQLHQFAELAAEAAEAAGAQGKFWEMHGTLFQNQHHLSGDDVVNYAENLGLDLDRFISDVNQRKFRPVIERDLQSGIDSGVHGTPSFFINGKSHVGGFDAESLRAAILEAARA